MTDLRATSHRRLLAAIIVNISGSSLSSGVVVFLASTHLELRTGLILLIVLGGSVGGAVGASVISPLVFGRFTVRRAVTIVLTVQAVLTGIVTGSILSDSLNAPLLGGLSVVLALTAVLSNVGQLALAKELVPTFALKRFYASVEAATWSSLVLGPAFAGVLVSAAGFGTAYALDSLSFVAAAALTRTLPNQRIRAEQAPARFFAGLRYVRRSEQLWYLFLNAMAFGGCFAVITPIAREGLAIGLGENATLFGLALAVPGGAGVLGSIISRHIFPNNSTFPVLGALRSIGFAVTAAGICVTGVRVLSIASIVAGECVVTFFAGLFNPGFSKRRVELLDPDSVLATGLAWSTSARIVQSAFLVVGSALTLGVGRSTVAIFSAVALLGIVPLMRYRTVVG